jgi:hypothetical protein
MKKKKTYDANQEKIHIENKEDNKTHNPKIMLYMQ